MRTNIQRTISIGIIDDHTLFRHSLRALLLTIDFIDEVKLISPPKSDGFRVPKESFHLILLDISMPYMNGFEVYEQIRICKANQKIAFLSELSDKKSLFTARKLGANGFILKRVGKKALENSLKKILFESNKDFPLLKTTPKLIAWEKTKTFKLGKIELLILHTLIKEYTMLTHKTMYSLNENYSTSKLEELIRKYIETELAKELGISKRATDAYLNRLYVKFKVHDVLALIQKSSLVNID